MGSFTHDRCAGKVRSIQAYHMDTKGWADIAYNWVVCPHGYVFEGRGWGKRSAANGANGCNSVYHAVCYLGGDGDPFTDQAKAGFNACRAEWARIYGRSPEVVPHSACVSTACPGNVIRQWIASGMGGGVAPAPIGVKPMYDPPLGPIAAVWQDESGKVLAAVSPTGDVYAWGVPHVGNFSGNSWWGNRRAARIGARDDGRSGYMVTATSGEKYRLPH